MASKSMATIGYGVPTNEIDPQRFVVRIPANGRDLVEVIEDFGITGPQYDPRRPLPSRPEAVAADFDRGAYGVQ